jgi:hypothetical protein
MRGLREHERSNAPSALAATAESATELPGLVKKKIVARAASVSCRSVENWMRQKRIPFVRLSPRCVRFHLPSVLAALRKFEVREVA